MGKKKLQKIEFRQHLSRWVSSAETKNMTSPQLKIYHGLSYLNEFSIVSIFTQNRIKRFKFQTYKLTPPKFENEFLRLNREFKNMDKRRISNATWRGLLWRSGDSFRGEWRETLRRWNRGGAGEQSPVTAEHGASSEGAKGTVVTARERGREGSGGQR